MAQWSPLLNLDLVPITPKTLLQGAVYEPVKREWFLSQAVSSPRGEIMAVHRYDRTGKFLDSMRLEYSHGSPFGVRNIPSGQQIWFGQDQTTAAGTIFDRQVKRVLFKPRYEFAASTRMITTFVYAGDWARPFLDVANNVAVTRSKSSAGVETYIRRRISDVLDQKDSRLNLHTYKMAGSTFQGAACSGNYLYRMYGGTSSADKPLDTVIYENRWSDGVQTRKVVLPKMGLNPGEVRGYEPEGLTMMGKTLVAGVRVGGHVINRTFRLGKITF